MSKMRCKATELTDVTLGSCRDKTKKGAQKSSMETEKKGGEWHGRKIGPCGVMEAK